MHVQMSVGPDICHRGCANTLLQTVQSHREYSADYGTVHYELRTLEIIRNKSRA